MAGVKVQNTPGTQPSLEFSGLEISLSSHRFSRKASEIHPKGIRKDAVLSSERNWGVAFGTARGLSRTACV